MNVSDRFYTTVPDAERLHAESVDEAVEEHLDYTPIESWPPDGKLVVYLWER